MFTNLAPPGGNTAFLRSVTRTKEASFFGARGEILELLATKSNPVWVKNQISPESLTSLFQSDRNIPISKHTKELVGGSHAGYQSLSPGGKSVGNKMESNLLNHTGSPKAHGTK